MPTLAETQTTLWQLITAPETVAEAPPFVEGDAQLPAVARVNIYANMYFFRILDSLKEDFPELLCELGDDQFHNLIVQYLQAYPPTHYSLRYAGQHLAEFMETVPPLCKGRLGGVEDSTSPDPSLQRRGSLVSIARFEWAQLEAFDAADAVPLTAADLQRIPADQWPALVLKLHPSVQLLDHDHQLVWRQGLDVVHRVADDVEWRLMMQIRSGREFAVLCENAAPETILNYLQTWISQGLLV